MQWARLLRCRHPCLLASWHRRWTSLCRKRTEVQGKLLHTPSSSRPKALNARTLRSRFSRKVVARTSLHTEGPHRASRVFINGGSPCSAHAGPQFQASPYSLISGGAICASPRSQVVVTGGSLAMRRFKLAALISLSSSPGWAFSGETCFWAAVARAHRGGTPPGQWPMPK